MCSRHQPEAGADSGLVVGPITVGWPDDIWNVDASTEPEQAACGHWIELDEMEGFCNLLPLHDGPCQPPRYEVVD